MSKLETILWERFSGGNSRLQTSLLGLLAEARAISGATGSELVFDLLNRYTYLARDSYDEAIECIANYIISDFDIDKTLLCATTADHKKDSAQAVLYDLVTAMGLFGYNKILSANRYDRAQKFAGQIDDIILVDEFLGTGRSIIGRIKSISRVFSDKHIRVPRIHAVVIAGMEFGLRRVSPYASNVHAYLALKPGLRGFSSGASLSSAYASMDSFEGALAPSVYGYALPRLGDGECEALYGRDRGNCPNSVLPIFWWPKSKNGQNRSTPFSRVF